MSSKYKTCTKCGIRHSALVPHKCFKVKKDKAPELEEVEHDLEKGGKTISTDKNSGETVNSEGEEKDLEGEGETDPRAEAGADGEGDGEGEGDGDEGGEGEAEAKAEGEAEGEGDGDGEGEGEGPQPQAPEPEAPVVQVVCTVLKFAALCAKCAKYGSIEVTLTEDGLFVYGQNGDATAYDTLPWGEFEKRSTLDGEYYVKEVIDGVDAKLNEADDKARLQALIQQAKDGKLEKAKDGKLEKAKEDKKPAKKEQPAAKAGKLTLPLTLGQIVVRRDGKLATIVEGGGSWPNVVRTVPLGSDSKSGHVFRTTGVCAGGERDAVEADPKSHNPQDAMVDATLTLPLTAGQRVVRRDGSVATVEAVECRHKVANYESGEAVLARNGCANDGFPPPKEKQLHYDAVADAPEPEKTLRDGPLDWSKPIIGVKQDGTLVGIISHHMATPDRTYHMHVGFFENDSDQDVVSPCGAKRGFCYLESGLHHKYPDEMPVIRNI